MTAKPVKTVKPKTGPEPKRVKIVGQWERAVGAVLTGKPTKKKGKKKSPAGLTSALLAVMFALPALTYAAADQWTPYTDGRAGGCWVGHGQMYGCTPQPAAQAPAPEVVYVPAPAPARTVPAQTQTQPQVVVEERYIPTSGTNVPMPAPALSPGAAAAVNAQIAADVANPDAALKRELCRADPSQCK